MTRSVRGHAVVLPAVVAFQSITVGGSSYSYGRGIVGFEEPLRRVACPAEPQRTDVGSQGCSRAFGTRERLIALVGKVRRPCACWGVVLF